MAARIKKNYLNTLLPYSVEIDESDSKSHPMNLLLKLEIIISW